MIRQFVLLKSPVVVVTAAVILIVIQACGDERTMEAGDLCLVNLVSEAELDVQPVLIHPRRPSYPDAARLAGWSGSGTSYAIVNVDSSICSCGIARSSGRLDVDLSIIEATRSSKFAPGVLSGIAVRSRREQTFTFVLRDSMVNAAR
jgi:hypothetical protein